ncbi:hypothetical protein FCR2A7T_06310 [Flavobacterium cauense R2A-7]|nr:hypothetical protein FCR2A7T_06310 [Flavobacterium cauense R2A-7]
MYKMLLKMQGKYKKISPKSDVDLIRFKRIIRLLFWRLIIMNLII